MGFSCIEEIFVLILKLEWVAFGGSEFPISRNVQERGHEIRQDVLTDTLILCLWLRDFRFLDFGSSVGADTSLRSTIRHLLTIKGEVAIGRTDGINYVQL